MIWNLEPIWLTILIGCVAIIGFILAMALDAIMQRDGFGPIGNTVVVTGGFFLTIAGFNFFGYRMDDIQYATMAGLAGAFISVAVLAFAKAMLNRL